MDEFSSSLHSVFPDILDVNHLMKEISPLKKITNLSAAISQLKRNFFAPIEIEIPQKDNTEESKNHGHNVIRISELFAKLCFILKLTPQTKQNHPDLPSILKTYSNTFNSYSRSFQNPNSNDNDNDDDDDDDISIRTHDPRKINTNNLVFLWGFKTGTSARTLKNLLLKSHDVFSEDDVFEVRLVDKSCAVVVFWDRGSSDRFVGAVGSGEGSSEPLTELVSEGLTAAGYETYKKVCKLEFWEADLACSLDKGVAETDRVLEGGGEGGEVYWNNELMINLDDL